MFKYTIAAATKIVDDLKKIFFGLQIVFQTFLIAYPLCMLAFDFGVRIKNIILAVVSFGYLVFLLMTKDIARKTVKVQKKAVKHIVDFLKLTADGFAVFVLVDGIVTSQGDSDIFAYISLAVIGATWLAKVIGYWITWFASKELELLIDGFERDTYVFQFAKSRVNHFVHSMIGDAETEEPEPIISEENKRILDEAVAIRESRKAYKKAQESAMTKAFLVGLAKKVFTPKKKAERNSTPTIEAPTSAIEIPAPVEEPVVQIEAPKKKNPLAFLTEKKKKAPEPLPEASEEKVPEEALPKT